MMRVRKITAAEGETVEDAANEFFMREYLTGAEILHIVPVYRNKVADLAAVYVFYDEVEA